jgi:hypothetical protein
MKSTAIAVCIIVVLGFSICARALDREPTRGELVKIDSIRAVVEEQGWAWQAGPTSVSNLSDEGFRGLLGLRVPSDYEKRVEAARRAGRLVAAPPGMFFPPSFDWRAQGGVTSVKSQGSCGSCWAFCAVAAFESQILIHSGLEYNISEQAVLSCNTEGDGCDGGWMETAYGMWVAGGAVLEECMPYHEVDTDPCLEDSCGVVDAITGYYYVDDDVDAIKTALLDGPVAVAMAVCPSFSAYTGGCYEDNCTEVNHGVTIVGWDDEMCGGEGAWIVKNSWGPEWGENGYVYMKYGTCYIGYGAAAVNYVPGQTAHFFHASHLVDEVSGDGDGDIETGEVIDLQVTLLNIGAETATNVTGFLVSVTPGIDILNGTATYPVIAKGGTGTCESPHFRFVVMPGGPVCGPLRFHLAISSDQGASDINFVLRAGGVITVFEDDFETDKGWTVGAAGDGAATGAWERGDPEGTWWGDQPVQPDEDHTEASGSQCYVTGLSAGASQGTYDVDGGKTTLVSPAIDLSDRTAAVLSYYRWFASETGSNPNDDDFTVDISDDDGSSWTNLETVSCSAREWVGKEYFLEEYVDLTDRIRLRFVAADAGVGGSIVEAAVDDIKIAAFQTGAGDLLDPEVTVTAPNGGEVCMLDTYYDIKWNATDNLGVVSVDLLLSTDGGVTFEDTIATGEANDGIYTWHIPDMDSKTARLKVVAVDAAANRGEDLSDSDFVLWGSLSDIGPYEGREIPDRLVLEVRGANPAGRRSQIVFGLPAASEVGVDIYDVTGRCLANLLSGRQAEGYHTLDVDADRLGGASMGPGVYFIRLSCKDKKLAAKLVVAR